MKIVMLERVATPSAPHNYLLLASSLGTFEEDLNEASKQGLQPLVATLVFKSRLFAGEQLVVVLEQRSAEVSPYEYRLLGTVRTSTLQAEVTQARREGYEVLRLVHDSLVVLMGREMAR